jgi:hypothetical protein
MTANVTEFVNYLTDVACQRQLPVAAMTTPPILRLDDTMTPSAFIMNVLRHVGSAHPSQTSAAGVTHAAHPITRHGVDDMMDVMLTHPALCHTLQHAADIQEHFASTFLHQTSAVFQDHWTYIIVPAWNQLAQGAGAGSAAAGQ